MARVRFEELVAEGGTVEEPPKVGAGETFVNRAVNAIPFGRPVVDALSAAALEFGSSGGTRATLTPQAQAELEAMGEKVATPESLLERYRQARDRRAQRTELGSEQNPWAGGAGTAVGIGLTALAPLPKAAGTGLPAAAKTGATYGAIEGLTGGQADLTRGEFGEALGETAKGALFGAGAGALGQGLVNLGRRGAQALRGAREEVLAQETVAAREAAEEGQAALAKEVDAHRELVGRARGMMAKDFSKREAQHGQALELNKARDARSARQSERAQALLERAGRRRGQPAAPEDPSTKVLVGMSRKARQAQQSRTKDARAYRRDMGDPDVDTKVAESWQEYIDEVPEALSDPRALRRQFMDQYLRQKYGDEMAERVMRERVGPGGEILPRSAAEEVTEVAARPALPPGGEQLPLMPPLERVPTMARTPRASLPEQPPVLGPPPTPRPGAQGMPYGQNLRPEPQAPTTPAAPRALEGSPTAPARQPTGDIQDVTRLAGPEDVAPLAAERAMAREQGALGAIGRAGMEGVRSSGNVLGAILGGVGGVSREVLKDPAVRAMALSAARLHLLQRINPELFARVGGTLTAAAARGEYRARKYLEMRSNPELRKAEQQASEEAARLSDEQLLELLSGAPAQP